VAVAQSQAADDLRQPDCTAKHRPNGFGGGWLCMT